MPKNELQKINNFVIFQTAELFDTTKQNISLHLQNIFKEKELEEKSVVKDFLATASDKQDKNYISDFDREVKKLLGQTGSEYLSDNSEPLKK